MSLFGPTSPASISELMRREEEAFGFSEDHKNEIELQPLSGSSNRPTLNEIIARSPSEVCVEDLTSLIVHLNKYKPELTEDEIKGLRLKIGLIPEGMATEEKDLFTKLYLTEDENH